MKKLLCASVIAGLAVLPGTAQAFTIEGTLDVGGGVIVGPTTIDFTPAGGGTGLEDILDTTTLVVNGIPVNDLLGAIAKDLDQATFPVSGFTTPLDFYEQLVQFPTVNFQLQDIQSCAELQATSPGISCGGLDPNLSPFGFVQLPGSVLVTFQVTGEVFDSAEIDGQRYDFLATYTAQFNTLAEDTIPELLAAFAPGCVTGTPTGRTCGFIDTSFSASKVVITDTQVPEPATLMLLGSGLVGFAVRARRRRNNA